MPTGTGLDAQIGYVAESAWGTAATVTRFLPLVSETLKKDIARLESPGILTGRQVATSQQWAPGNATVAGDVQHELYDQSLGLLLRAAFGTVDTTAAGGGTAVHTFWPVSPGVSLTIQVGRPLVYGTVQPFTYEGCKIRSWELAAAAGEIATWGMSVLGEEETMGTALASASFATNLRPWTFQTMSFSLLGTTTPVKNFRIAGDNMLAERRFLGSTVISEPLREDLAAYTGELQMEWGNPAARGTLNYHAFFGGTEGTLLATLSSGTLYGTITANVRFDGTTPNVAGRGIVEHPIPFKCIASGSLDQHAIQVSIRNNDATA